MPQSGQQNQAHHTHQRQHQQACVIVLKGLILSSRCFKSAQIAQSTNQSRARSGRTTAQILGRQVSKQGLYNDETNDRQGYRHHKRHHRVHLRCQTYAHNRTTQHRHRHLTPSGFLSCQFGDDRQQQQGAHLRNGADQPTCKPTFTPINSANLLGK